MKFFVLLVFCWGEVFLVGFFLRAMSGPTLTDSLVVFTFCFPQFNLPQPSHSLIFLGRGFDFFNFNFNLFFFFALIRQGLLFKC